MTDSSIPPPKCQETKDDDQQCEQTVEAEEKVEDISNAVEEMEPEEQEEAGVEESIPDWVHSLLRKKFFKGCLVHDAGKQNETNKYCITCDLAACKHCISSGSHDDHKVLKIHHHSYQDVVPLSEMQDHFDCKRVQPYKCNKKTIVSLHPLPHCGSGAQCQAWACCDICRRKLFDPKQYHFCCISCKVHAFYKNKGKIPPLLLQSRRMVGLERVGRSESSKRKRKGTPQRASLP
ncbi:OLC1v1024778C1 [Oldenlandia corymbosa var. corymbosa]|uniref:OLC1v1024778C1 n=1 Tax=Oldenlandia corymbosa var. corymbosa TaxID=529605 RepID=A0AAV1C677_OLDCO|nr:OLC1v1024778C1 [Oldenlandia corymbosa var. corymbosa]